MSSAEVNAIEYANQIFFRFWSFFILIPRIIGHSCSIYVFTRRTLHSNPCVRYFLAATISGLLFLLRSIAGYMGAPSTSHYCASKWGVRGLTQAAAIELAQHKITVNAYCPGVVETQLMDGCATDFAKERQLSKEEVYSGFMQKILLGRFAKPDDIANFVSYLASEESNYMTGQSVIIDGGFSLS
ncbi:hypothetical protein I4U23_004150 [Adineta vaga]|nr:hypothetical protein I4U23_004150 [Adineta vaga]